MFSHIAALTALISWYAAILNSRKKKKRILNASFELASNSDCYVKANRKMQSSNEKSTVDFSGVTAWESEKLTETEATVQPE